MGYRFQGMYDIREKVFFDHCTKYVLSVLCNAFQGTTTSLVNSGQQLLATSRQMAPQLQQLAALAGASKSLRAQAEQLRQLSGVLLTQPQQQQQQEQQKQERQHPQEQEEEEQAG